MQLVVFGGGCWGHHHVSGLLKAKEAGRAVFDRLVVVDREPEHRVRAAFGDRVDVTCVTSDWHAFLVTYLGDPQVNPADMLVPAPVAPHLFLDWLRGALQRELPEFGWETGPMPDPLKTPFETVGPNGERFVSFAEWMCPPNCLEPKRCPAIRAPRTWEMPETVASYGRKLGALEVAVFHSRHYAWGIAALPVSALLEARGRVARAIARHRGGDVLVATVSACHGVVGRLTASRTVEVRQP